VRINHLPLCLEKWIFLEIYNSSRNSFILSDSRIQIALGKNIKIVDSTTISLFKDILKWVEEILTGKKQGGIKSHSVANADEKLPNLVWSSQYNAPSVLKTQMRCR
jgi:hypothetical protein